MGAPESLNEGPLRGTVIRPVPLGDHPRRAHCVRTHLSSLACCLQFGLPTAVSRRTLSTNCVCVCAGCCGGLALSLHLQRVGCRGRGRWHGRIAEGGCRSWRTAVGKVAVMMPFVALGADAEHKKQQDEQQRGAREQLVKKIITRVCAGPRFGCTCGWCSCALMAVRSTRISVGEPPAPRVARPPS